MTVNLNAPTLIGRTLADQCETPVELRLTGMPSCSGPARSRQPDRLADARGQFA